MPVEKLNFTTLDVFTSTRFLGNPLAIVKLPKNLEGGDLTQDQKQTIAREFNFSETVFLHEEDDTSKLIVIDIFTTDQELPFAGHPTVGSGWYLLSNNPSRESVTLRTKAGDILVVRREPGSNQVRLEVPTNFRDHPPYALPNLKNKQTGLAQGDYVNGLDGAEAVASIVKGMTFVLLRLTSEDALARLHAFPDRLRIPEIGEWGHFVGVYAFYERDDGVIRARMFDGGLEDPATGSAASTLGGWLGKKRGEGQHRIRIIQGVEMGRKSEIEVVVDIGNERNISKIQLAGAAVEVAEGKIARI